MKRSRTVVSYIGSILLILGAIGGFVGAGVNVAMGIDGGADIALTVVMASIGVGLLVWGIKRIRNARAGIPNTDLWGH